MLAERKKRGKKKTGAGGARTAPEARRRKKKKLGTLLRPSSPVRAVQKCVVFLTQRRRVSSTESEDTVKGVVKECKLLHCRLER